MLFRSLLGCIPIHGRDLIEPAQDRTSEYYKVILRIGKQLRLTEGIMVNNFMELEGSAIKAFEEVGKISLYPVGPIIQIGSSNQVDRSDCLRWLDNQPRESVLFVFFGSGGTLSHHQMTELALGLELSGQKFLSVRCKKSK